MFRVDFATGARSDYGPSKSVLRAFQTDPRFALEIVVHGMHLAAAFGDTLREIRKDKFAVKSAVRTLEEHVHQTKAAELCATIDGLAKVWTANRPDIVFVLGDRLETYASALAAHLLGIPIAHSGGGHLTRGAVDDIYRFNITNLSSVHFATNRAAFDRLRSLPLLDVNQVFFVGSASIDSIHAFLKAPQPLHHFFPDIGSRPFALMTFHPATAAEEPLADVMQAAIDTILGRHCAVVITAPNNDSGFKAIEKVIRDNDGRDGVYYIPHLGATAYYAALNDCLFTIGNSSSGISEAPYFNKPAVDVGSRQEGRDCDVGTRHVAASSDSVVSVLVEGFRDGWPKVSCNSVYGEGGSANRILNALHAFLESSLTSRCTNPIPY